MLLDSDVQSSCSTLSQSNAVFVGRVVEIWPAREVLASQQHLSRPQLRHLILKRWRGALSADEERYTHLDLARNSDRLSASGGRNGFVLRDQFGVAAMPSGREGYYGR